MATRRGLLIRLIVLSAVTLALIIFAIVQIATAGIEGPGAVAAIGSVLLIGLSADIGRRLRNATRDERMAEPPKRG